MRLSSRHPPESHRADDASLDLVKDELAPKLYRIARLILDDDLRLRLADAQELFHGKEDLAVDTPPYLLHDRLTRQDRQCSDCLTRRFA